jgi:hypothetical protein
MKPDFALARLSSSIVAVTRPQRTRFELVVERKLRRRQLTDDRMSRSQAAIFARKIALPARAIFSSGRRR